jgi:hypothetical protein
MDADAYSALTDSQIKVWENRLRRKAGRQGLTLTKSRRRDQHALDFGTYGLVNAETGYLVAGSTSTGYGLSLDEVERNLTAD